ncbi:MAG: SymE family type I addiction module toxin [Sediminibacterium sp.]
MNSDANLRKLTVGYQWTARKFSRQEQQPKINLSGNWLQKLGFTIGETCSIIATANYIQIVKDTTPPRFEEPTTPGDEVLPDFVQYLDSLHYEGYSDNIRIQYRDQWEELFEQYKHDYHRLM